MIGLSLRRFVANALCRLLPSSRYYPLKRAIWRTGGVTLGRNTRIVSSVSIWTAGPVDIGDNSFLGHEVLIVGGDAPVVIGAACDIGPRVTIATGTHEEGDLERAAGPGISYPIVVGNGVWIGVGATLIAGVTVGSGAIIGAGSLVNRNIPAEVVAAGVPCKVIRTRTSKNGLPPRNGD